MNSNHWWDNQPFKEWCSSRDQSPNLSIDKASRRTNWGRIGNQGNQGNQHNQDNQVNCHNPTNNKWTLKPSKLTKTICLMAFPWESKTTIANWTCQICLTDIHLLYFHHLLPCLASSWSSSCSNYFCFSSSLIMVVLLDSEMKPQFSSSSRMKYVLWKLKIKSN